MTHVLLTGANSFIGPHVLKHLIAAGHNVTAVGRRPPINTSNTSNYITLDLNQRKGFDQLPKDVNAIIHLAAQLPTPSTTVSQLVANNILATRNTISYAIKSGVTRFIYASTRSVYGQVSTAIVDELTPIIDPSTYGLTKYAAELLLEDESSILPSLAIRLPGVLGPKAKRHWIPDVLESMLVGRTVTIYNPDAPFNNIMHADNIGKFICNLLTQSWRGFYAFPIAAGNCLSVRTVAERLRVGLASKASIEVGPQLTNTYTVSSHMAMNIFGYKPEPMEIILDRYLDDINLNQ